MKTLLFYISSILLISSNSEINTTKNDLQIEFS
ncbi:MAG: hypothetical protein ACI9N1_001980 [Flavobacteriales bacterium]|jgi:hypothetical protein